MSRHIPSENDLESVQNLHALVNYSAPESTSANVLFEASPLLCLSCRAILCSTHVDYYNLLQSTYQNLLHSCQACQLCQLISQTLPRTMDHNGTKAFHPMCQFPDLANDPDARIWVIKRYRYGIGAENSHEPLAHLEVILKKGLPQQGENKRPLSDQSPSFAKGERYLWGLTPETNTWLQARSNQQECIVDVESRARNQVRNHFTVTLPTDPLFDELNTPHRHCKYTILHMKCSESDRTFSRAWHTP
jgi:hypothetical protein